MTDPSDARAEPDFYARAEHWFTRATEIINDPNQAHHCLLAGVGYALLAAVQMDRRHSAAINRRITERETAQHESHNRGDGERDCVIHLAAQLAGVGPGCLVGDVVAADRRTLAVASPAGKRIAALVARYCTEGNCAPMGVETFDPTVVAANALTCTPEVVLRAVENVNDAGATRGPGGLPTLLPELNLVYGLPGETHRTHVTNLTWLNKIYERGLLCHRTNVRQVRAFPRTPLAAIPQREPPPSAEHFLTWKAEIDQTWDAPMKVRVYPRGLRVAGLHSFFVTGQGTWFRRLGSYSIQILESDTAWPLYEPADLVVTGHAPRHLFGARRVA